MVALSRAIDAKVQRMENSILYKTFCLIPFLGIIPSFLMETTLIHQSDETSKKEVSRLIEWISLKNQYYAVDAVRDLLTVACLAAHLFKVFIPMTNLLCAVFAMHVIRKCFHIYKNGQLIDQLEASGWQRGMRIY